MRYVPHLYRVSSKNYSRDLLSLRIIAFADSGYDSLPGSRSSDGNLIAGGEILRLDGVIYLHGLLLDHRCVEIHRSLRSSFISENHAKVSTADHALW